MRITKHDKSYIVELSDSSAWRIWPADMADTLQWLRRKLTLKKSTMRFARTHSSIGRTERECV
jgi:hypothetical protein